VIEKLPKGSRDAYREVKSPEDLERLKVWMTEHGTEIQSRNVFRRPAAGAYLCRHRCGRPMKPPTIFTGREENVSRR
jgi:hypothetical protein